MSMKTIRHLHYRYLYESDELDTRSLSLPALSVEVRHPGEQKTNGQLSADSHSLRFSDKMVPCTLSACRRDQEEILVTNKEKKSSLKTFSLV